MKRGIRIPVAAVAILAIAGGIAYFLSIGSEGDPRLAGFIHSLPPIDIVFTSRSEPASLEAAAPDGEGFTAPGMPLWNAREGRLRLLTASGKAIELTWGKRLPDGTSLIDVMGPTVSNDAKRILFAGRRDSGHGRFRIYEIGVDGKGLRQLTGGPGDPGCVAPPPMRWRADGSPIPDAERKATDYDDVDPIALDAANQRVVFASSRVPDLGRDHARRSTSLWLRHSDGMVQPLTANRNNDRWPYLLSSGFIAFSLWSRNREVIPADLGDVRPDTAGVASATAPTDAWFGAFTQVPGGHFGMLVKPATPVWRPRPLFANRIAFMTPMADGTMTVAQVTPGTIASAPSSIGAKDKLPATEPNLLRYGPVRDAAGNRLNLATPSACPPSNILLAGSAGNDAYGLFIANDDWPTEAKDDSAAIGLRKLFDDPGLVDAEPVAVYVRTVKPIPADKREPAATDNHGHLFATAIDTPTLMGDLPGQKNSLGNGPIFDAPPHGAIDHLRIYAARRDRFDDPLLPRVPGGWEFLMKVPVRDGAASGKVSTDSPTMLAGYGKDGRLVRWTTPAGGSASFHAFAGDHYSLARPGGRTFCVGCHPGHSGVSAAYHEHSEHLK